jgi:uncharacterized membrane protein YbhN (UPF0104 family)
MTTGTTSMAELLDPADLAAESLPEEFSASRLRRSLLVLVIVLVAVVAAVSLLPGLGSLRSRFSGAQPGWLLVAVGLVVLRCASYVAAFRAVFCRRVGWRTSGEIGLSELAANSLLSVGGAGGLALGAWIMRRGGVDPDHIGRRTVAFFLLTSAANVTFLVVGGLGLATGILAGADNAALGLVPAVVGLCGIGLVCAVRPLAHRAAGRTGRRKIATLLRTVGNGVDESVLLLRRRDPLLLAGAAGYVLFDVATLGVCFAAFGNDVPAAGALLVAYIIGQLGGLIPIPGGIGGVDGGLIGTLMLYGVHAADAAVAVLAYRGLLLALPLVLGLPALALLRRRLRTEEHDLAQCSAGGEIEVIGRGRVRIGHA